MALSEQQQQSLLGVTSFMFDFAPGTESYARFESILEANPSFYDLGTNLAETDEFQSQYNGTDELINLVFTRLGIEEGTQAYTRGTDFITTRIEQDGIPVGQVLMEVGEKLLQDTPPEGLEDAAATLQNKIAVSKSYYESGIEGYSKDTIPGLLDGVTADEASVTEAQDKIEAVVNPASLTDAITSYQSAINVQSAAVVDLNEFVGDSDDLSGTYEATVESADAAITEAEDVLEAATDARDDFVETTVGNADGLSDDLFESGTAAELQTALQEYLGNTAELTEANLQTALAGAQDNVDSSDAIYDVSSAGTATAIADATEVYQHGEGAAAVYLTENYDAANDIAAASVLAFGDGEISAAEGDELALTIDGSIETFTYDQTTDGRWEDSDGNAVSDLTVDVADGEVSFAGAVVTAATFTADGGDAVSADSIDTREAVAFGDADGEVELEDFLATLDQVAWAEGVSTDDAAEDEIADFTDAAVLADAATASDLQTAMQSAESDLENARGSVADEQLLTELRSAISSYVDAGGSLTADAGRDTDGTVGELLDDLNAALNDDAADAVEVFVRDEFVGDANFNAEELLATFAQPSIDDADNEIDSVEDYEPTAAQQSLLNALEAVESRSELIVTAEDATAEFNGTTEGDSLNLIQDSIYALEGLETDVTDAEQLVTDVTGLADAVKDAIAGVESAEQTLSEDFGVEDLVELGADAEAGTTDAGDVFLFTENTESIALTNFENDDRLFVGTEFSEERLADDADLGAQRLGEPDELEVFIQQDGDNAVLSFEAEGDAFAGSDLSTDGLTQVTLQNVNADDLQLVDGFIGFRAEETVEIA